VPRGGGIKKSSTINLEATYYIYFFFLMKIQGHNLVKKQIIWFEGFCDQPEGYL